MIRQEFLHFFCKIKIQYLTQDQRPWCPQGQLTKKNSDDKWSQYLHCAKKQDTADSVWEKSPAVTWEMFSSDLDLVTVLPDSTVRAVV